MITITKEISTITISQTVLKYQQIQGFLIMKCRLWDDSGSFHILSLTVTIWLRSGATIARIVLLG